MLIPFSFIDFSESRHTFSWSTDSADGIFFGEYPFIEISNLEYVFLITVIEVFPKT